MSRIEFPLPDWQFAEVDLGTELHIYDRSNPSSWIESDTTVEVKQ